MKARTAKGAINEARRELDYSRGRAAEIWRQRRTLLKLLEQLGAEIEFAATLSKANQLRDWAFGACRYAIEMGVISDEFEREIDKTLEWAYMQAAKRIAAQRADERVPS